ncbi:hypothetical protein G6L37_12435 [Agrobacterium rubi]|uniref:hypothetical protein n=1 Tax=Agrobacterium rubi TaxID=28099 RepID=UPI00157336CE|nr:hypothetical protein [Agrobacterium rubi]NTF06969.1 hypothetical protein [Agrobacterium rubi]NTF19210.1 hypothetical protein [Agrobacterium rubi]NTF26173.1 hypothetical protein [Agrobacterium rubi]
MSFPEDLEVALTAFSRDNGLQREAAIERILRDRLLHDRLITSKQKGIPPEKLNASNDD